MENHFQQANVRNTIVPVRPAFDDCGEKNNDRPVICSQTCICQSKSIQGSLLVSLEESEKSSGSKVSLCQPSDKLSI